MACTYYVSLCLNASHVNKLYSLSLFVLTTTGQDTAGYGFVHFCDIATSHVRSKDKGVMV